ncbi:MAG TPA: hypothetical protein PKM58_04570 [Pyrinomonadaceae bacterium]|nr:hypothetical protein [Pyrinomonadaceae bacterium]
MARNLIFEFDGTGLSAGIEKVDRSKLYGSTTIEAFDEDGKKTEMISLAADGQTLFGIGGTAFATLSLDNDPIKRDSLTAYSMDGEPLETVPSSFDAPIKVIERATIEDYLSHLVKSVYALTGDDAAAIADRLSEGAIYKFQFSYRGGIMPDTAFLLSNAEGEPFMILTTPANINFVGFQDAAAVYEDVDEESDDELDFEMM